MATICLAMIVKDEAPVLARCLASVRPYIARYVICDTGSTDGTPGIALAALTGIQGEIHHDTWASFAKNRTDSIERARRSGCDYILVLDADERFHVDDPACLDDLTADAYILRESHGPVSWLAQRLIKATLPWRYVGALHELLECEGATSFVLLSGASITTEQDGARSRDPQKIEKDIAVLERAIEEEPGNARYRFHLAMGYQKVGRTTDAIAAFEHRLCMDSPADVERWYAGLQLGKCYADDKQHWKVVPRLLEAYADFPATAEPLYWLARFHMERCEYEQALPYLELAATKQKPDGLFVREDRIYDYEARLYLARCLVRLNRPGDAEAILLDLSANGALPDGAIPDEDMALLAGHGEQGGD